MPHVLIALRYSSIKAVFRLDYIFFYYLRSIDLPSLKRLPPVNDAVQNQRFVPSDES